MRSSMITARVFANLPDVVLAECGSKSLDWVCDQANLPSSLFDGFGRDREFYVPQKSFLKFLTAAGRRLGEPRLGLVAAASRMSVLDWGIWGDYVLSAPTLRQALKRGMRAQPLHASYDRYQFIPDPRGLRVDYQSAVYGAKAAENISYLAAGIILNSVRRYTGARWQPEMITLDFADPRAADRAEEALGGPVHFGTPSVGFVIPWDMLDRPLHGGLPRRPVTLADVVRARRGKPPEGLPEIVAELVRVQVMNGLPSLDHAAESLSLGTRTLQRRLNTHSTSFREIANAVVVERAKDLLREPDLTITHIGASLGYSSAAHFARAFSNEVGMNPGNYRRAWSLGLLR